jgi:signal peptidase I
MHRFVMIWLLLCVVGVVMMNGCSASNVDTASRASTAIPVAGLSGPVSSFIYRVPSGAMEPTLLIGVRVAIKKRPPSVGAIVVYYSPEGFAAEECGPKAHVVKSGGAACDMPIPKVSKIMLIKRIVAGPEDEIYVRKGHVYRKVHSSDYFVRENDSYIRACGARSACNFPSPIRIPAGHWFLMGDNRGESDDSRFWGPVPTAWIVGTAMRAVTHR